MSFKQRHLDALAKMTGKSCPAQTSSDRQSSSQDTEQATASSVKVQHPVPRRPVHTEKLDSQAGSASRAESSLFPAKPYSFPDPRAANTIGSGISLFGNPASTAQQQSRDGSSTVKPGNDPFGPSAASSMGGPGSRS